MCNCKGWDFVYYSDSATILPHFCRTYGDCGSVDITIEEAADKVAEHYQQQHDWHSSERNENILFQNREEYLQNLLKQRDLWINRTHEDFTYYAA